MGRPKGYRDMSSQRWKNEAEIRRLHAEGLQTGDIGKQVGMRAEAVRRLLVEIGLPRNPQTHKGSRNPAWKGGRIVDKSGYILLWMPDHPHCSKSGRVREHRLVVEKRLGRYLDPVEVVDHINGICGDNRDENLRLFPSNAEHLRVTLKGRCPQWTEEGKERMRQGVIRSNITRRLQRKSGA